MTALREIFTPRSLMKIGLLLLAMSAFASGLATSLTGTQPGTFRTVAWFAVSLAWLLAFTKLRSGNFWVLLFLVGGAFIFIHAAQLWNAVGALISTQLEFQLGLMGTLFKNPVPDPSSAHAAFETFLQASGQMLQRVIAALQTRSLDDTGVREFVWDIPTLMVAGWAGWMLKRRDHALLALGPSLGILAYILYYTGTRPGWLQLIVCVLLLLMGISEWEKRMSQKTMTAGLERAASEVKLTLAILSFAITVAAGLAPSLNLRHAILRIQQSAGELRNQQMAAALGLEEDPNSRRRFTTTDLPREHLVGAPPAVAQTVVFSVKTGDLPPFPNNAEFNREFKQPIPHYYWRSLTYDIYNGHGWQTTLSETIDYQANQALLGSVPEGYRMVHLDVSKTQDADSLLYWTGTLVSVDQAFRLGWRGVPGSIPATEDPFGGADALGATTEPSHYKVDAVLPAPSTEALKAASQDYPETIRNRYLALPALLPQRVRDLATQITDGMTNPYDKAVALEAYLRTYPYSLNVPPPPPDQDVADYFLFTLRTGYCDYYATSMVVMARSLGLPARLVAGYSSGTYNISTAEYVVRQANAHSWPEIYFTGIGWVEFEPTASQPGIRRPNSVQPTPPVAIPQKPNPGAEANPVANPQPAARDLPVAGILIATMLATGLALYLWQARRLAKADISQIYPWVFKMGSRIAPLPGVPETPLMFDMRLRETLERIPGPRLITSWISLAASELEFLTRLYVRALYSPHAPAESEHAEARQTWRKLYWRLLLARVLRGKVRPLMFPQRKRRYH